MSYANLGDWCADIADAIRAKDGTLGAINHADFPARIAAIQTGYTLAEVFCHGYDKDPLIIDDGHNVNYTIPAGVFYIDTGIKGLVAEDCRDVSASAFYGCTGIKYVKMGSAVFNVYNAAFMGCSGLEQIEWTGVCKIDERAFRNCDHLETADIAAYQVSKNAFYGCSALETVRITGTVRTIQSAAFSGCTNLTALILDKSDSTVTTLSNTDAFSGTPIASGTGYIYVPDEQVNDFKAATNWNTYATQIKGISEIPAGVTITPIS